METQCRYFHIVELRCNIIKWVLCYSYAIVRYLFLQQRLQHLQAKEEIVLTAIKNSCTVSSYPKPVNYLIFLCPKPVTVNQVKTANPLY